jgi:hypothetical protein
VKHPILVLAKLLPLLPAKWLFSVSAKVVLVEGGRKLLIRIEINFSRKVFVEKII